MFEQSLVNSGRTRTPQTVLLSTLIQAALIAAAALLPLLHAAGFNAPRPAPPPVAFALQPAPVRARPLPPATSFRALLAAPAEPAQPAPPAFLYPSDTIPAVPAPPAAPGLAGPAGPPPLPGPTAPLPPPPLAAPPSAPIEVGGAIQAARCLSCPPPLYPSIARQLRLEGVVRLRAQIGPNGRIVALVPEQGNAILIAAARRALLHWRYRPLLLNGAPVPVATEITVRFTLN
jgi:protein TonB